MSANLSDLTIGQLVNQYNSTAAQMGLPVVKTFRDKPTAVRRLTKLLDAKSGGQVVEFPKTTKPAPEPKPAPKSRPRGGVNFLGMRSDIRSSTDKIALSHSNSIRYKAFQLLREGATQDQLAKLFEDADAARGKSRKTTLRRIYEMIRIFCYHYGYGTQSSEDGKVIKLVD